MTRIVHSLALLSLFVLVSLSEDSHSKFVYESFLDNPLNPFSCSIEKVERLTVEGTTGPFFPVLKSRVQ